VSEFSKGFFALFLCALTFVKGDTTLSSVDCIGKNGTIHDFSELDLLEQNRIELSDFSGKYVLVVNVATY